MGYCLRSLVVVFAVIDTGCGGVSAQRDSNTAPVSTVGEPALLSPKHRDTVPRPGVDPPCRPGPGCAVVNVEGQIPPGLTPILAVAPLQASPRIWIQPAVTAIRRDGTFDAIVYLGTERVGAGERYTIYVFGCKNPTRFRPEDIIESLPSDCAVSDPVTVTRVK
jgi:hypothetical protein